MKLQPLLEIVCIQVRLLAPARALEQPSNTPVDASRSNLPLAWQATCCRAAGDLPLPVLASTLPSVTLAQGGGWYVRGYLACSSACLVKQPAAKTNCCC